ncbi:MAG: sugar phosphate isomerase/epimerase family protein, partial [Dongiaceae bacterium]
RRARRHRPLRRRGDAQGSRMRLAVSNIAWNDAEEAAVLPLLRQRGIAGIEVAPTRLWPDWTGATPAAVRAARTRLADAGFCVPSLQAILFGKPDLSLFGGGDAFADHIRRVADLAAELGARIMVYGAPKSRDRGDLTPAIAFDRAVTVLRAVAADCAARGTTLCIEPNPVAYGCNFVTNSRDGMALVKAVDSRGFGLHLDTGAMTLAGEDPADALLAAQSILDHVHVSAPNLAPIAPATIDHARIGRALRQMNYGGWIAVEMRRGDDAVEALARSIDLARDCYRGRLGMTALPGKATEAVA